MHVRTQAQKGLSHCGRSWDSQSLSCRRSISIIITALSGGCAFLYSGECGRLSTMSQQHNVTVIRTTSSSSNVTPSSPGFLDLGYPRTTPAILKLCQAVCLLIAFLCVRCSLWTDYSAYSYFEVITICFMILIIILYVVNLFRIYRLLTCVSWPLAELLHYAICTFLLLIGSIVAAVKSYTFAGLVAGSVFGFIATFLCVVGMVLSYKVSFVTQSSDVSL
ncbi:CKLF-like MARVEL transmembrane domain-containing protein 7 [Hyperolius riggenbachi]|uniref:CKLF-like MARVEL transmembrane domain-containing protein 7 n=1 Tax=Hyperolius riggenbachi TaxID=752182 RepID=UPI0035A2C97F